MVELTLYHNMYAFWKSLSIVFRTIVNIFIDENKHKEMFEQGRNEE